MDSDSSDCSGVSLYQQQKRVRLSLPCGESSANVLAVPSAAAGGADPILADPEMRSHLYKRRSAVHGLSPNTNLSIGAVM